jgi:hypothetical protein
MLSDQTLEQIAANLACLALPPALHLRVAVAVVAPLLGEAKSQVGTQPEPKPNGAAVESR